MVISWSITAVILIYAVEILFCYPIFLQAGGGRVGAASPPLALTMAGVKVCSGQGESLPKQLIVQNVEALVQRNQPEGMDVN